MEELASLVAFLRLPWGAGYDLLPGGNVNAAATDWRNHRRPRRLLGRPFRHCSVPPAAGHCSHKSVCFCDAAPAYQRARQ